MPDDKHQFRCLVMNNPDQYKIFKIENFSSAYPFSLTVDHQDELEGVKSIIEHFKGINFSQIQLIKVLDKKKIKLKHKPHFFKY